MINQEKEIREQAPPFSNKKRKILASVMFMFVFAIAIGLYTGKINPFNAENSNSKVYEFAAVPGGVPFKYDFAPELIPLIKPEGSAPYSFYLGSGVGFPPMGLKLDMNGVLKGTPTGTGTSKFEVCVKDVGGRSACKTYSMLVSPKTTPNKNSASNSGQNNNVVQGTTRSEKWEGTYSNRYVAYYWERLYPGLVCTTDTTAPISICMTWQGKNLKGSINFPNGLKDTSTQDPDGVCSHPRPPSPVDENGNPIGSGLAGHIDSSGNLKLDFLSFEADSYGDKPDDVALAVMTGNSMTAEFSNVYYNGPTVTMTNKGSFTLTKISDSCK